MRNDLLDSMRQSAKYWWTSLVIGLLAVMLGIWCLATPDSTLVALTFVFVAVFLINGIIEIVFAVSNKDTLDGWGWTLAGGIIDLLFGIILIVLPLPVITVMLIYFVGFWILFRSIMGIGAAIELQRYKVDGWGWLLALAILSIIFSFIFLLSPVFSGIFIVVLVSVAFIIYGIFRIYFAFRLKAMNDRINK